MTVLPLSLNDFISEAPLIQPYIFILIKFFEHTPTFLISFDMLTITILQIQTLRALSVQKDLILTSLEV